MTCNTASSQRGPGFCLNPPVTAGWDTKYLNLRRSDFSTHNSDFSLKILNPDKNNWINNKTPTFPLYRILLRFWKPSPEYFPCNILKTLLFFHTGPHESSSVETGPFWMWLIWKKVSAFSEKCDAVWLPVFVDLKKFWFLFCSLSFFLQTTKVWHLVTFEGWKKASLRLLEDTCRTSGTSGRNAVATLHQNIAFLRTPSLVLRRDVLKNTRESQRQFVAAEGQNEKLVLILVSPPSSPSSTPPLDPTCSGLKENRTPQL